VTDSSQATSQTPSQPATSDTAAVATAPTTSEPVAPAKVDTPAAPIAATPEVKPPETKAPDAAKPPDAAAPIIPETYTLPEIKDAQGKAIALNPEIMPVMAPAFKAAGLTQDKANELVKTFVAYQQTLPAKMLARDMEVTMKDPELGQLNWGKTQGMVNEALGAFTTPEFRQKLERWGIANDLEFVRVFAAIGRAMRGDTPARGQPTSASELSQADRIYGRAKKVDAS
jgi:hypothetical protein